MGGASPTAAGAGRRLASGPTAAAPAAPAPNRGQSRQGSRKGQRQPLAERGCRALRGTCPPKSFGRHADGALAVVGAHRGQVLVADAAGLRAVPSLLIDVPESYRTVAMELGFVGVLGRAHFGCALDRVDLLRRHRDPADIIDGDAASHEAATLTHGDVGRGRGRLIPCAAAPSLPLPAVGRKNFAVLVGGSVDAEIACGDFAFGSAHFGFQFLVSPRDSFPRHARDYGIAAVSSTVKVNYFRKSFGLGFPLGGGGGFLTSRSEPRQKYNKEICD